MCGPPLSVAAAVIHGIVAWNGVAALEQCRVPLFILRAEPGGSNAPARQLPFKPDLQFGMTVGAGHFHQFEAPEQVTPMMERFIQRLMTVSAL
jgi:pimeloyl-ACP methyl ester carboxylesterase